MSNYVEFRRFQFAEVAEETAQILADNNIDFEIDNTKPSFDGSFANSSIYDYILRVDESQLEAAEKLLFVDFESDGQRHFMEDFTTEELLHVLESPDEWEASDYAYAKKLLQKRDKAPDFETIKPKKTISENDKSVAASPLLIALGYLTSLAFGVGIIISLYILIRKRKNAEGKAFSYYDSKSIIHAVVMLIIFDVWFVIYSLGTEYFGFVL